MNLNRSCKLIELYAVCPKCKNDKMGNGKGGLVVEENTFERWCECGFKVKVEETGVGEFD